MSLAITPVSNIEPQSATERLISGAILSRHLDGLVALDPRLAAVREKAGEFEIRVSEPGFAGMAKTVCGQQLSVASARAIWLRFQALEGALDPKTFLTLAPETVRATGLSAGKYRTIATLAAAIADDGFDLLAIEKLPPPEAILALTALKGIGPWTAEIYLMFCASHPDIFPSGDLALQKAVAHALGLDARPNASQLIDIAQLWSPYRASAALLFWRYFAAIKQVDGILL